MASSGERWKRLRVRWTAPQGFLAIILFFFIALLFEYLMVASFQSIGLTDKNAWTATFKIPDTKWSFTITISLLFQIVPLSVIIVLLFNWAYLTKYTAFAPRRVVSVRKVSQPLRREQEKRRFRGLRRLSKRISRRLQRVGRAFRARIQRIRGVSYISQRLFFAKAAIRSALTVLIIFLCIFFLTIILEYPTLIHNSVVAMYQGNPSFLGFVQDTGKFARSIGQKLPPIGGLASAVNNALIGAGPGFRTILEGAGASLTQPIGQVDVVDKYLVSQNLAAWISAIFALIYGAYASSRSYRRAKVK